MISWGDLLLWNMVNGNGPFDDDDGWLEEYSAHPLKDGATTLHQHHLPPFLECFIIQEMDLTIAIDGPSIWDYTQLESLIHERHNSHPNLKSLVLVLDPKGSLYGDDIVPGLVQRANQNDDGFVFTTKSPPEYRRVHGTGFFTEPNRPRKIPHCTQWENDRYVLKDWVL
jgi:hypothetical protein